MATQPPAEKSEMVSFRKVAYRGIGGENKFRLEFDTFSLRIDSPRLTPFVEKSALTRFRKVALQEGTAKLLLLETIPQGVQMHRVRFHEFEFSDALFIFAAHQSDIDGTFHCNAANTVTDLFRPHGIEKLELAFGGEDSFHSATGDLDLTLHFDAAGARPNVTYFIYAIRGNCLLDMDEDSQGKECRTNQHLLIRLNNPPLVKNG